jgi:photosystem II stability/assembly factor-like uncharacterized protein
MNKVQRGLCFVVVVVFLAWAVAARADQPLSKGGPSEFRTLKFRLIGPAVGGRVCRAAGVPGDPLTFYAASASGGVWKSSDGGSHWKPIFDEQPIASIGSLAIAASDPNVLYVGSGEANIRGNVAPGNGIYKSTDAGKTWTHVWKQEGQIGTMIVHPTNPDIAFAAVLGHAFGPNSERGIYRTTDGGKTWQRVLYKDADTGASDVCFDPSNPRILFAGLWQARRQPWSLSSGGPGGGLYMSRDGGETWKQLLNKEGSPDTPGKGLPEGIWGKIGVAVAPSDGQRVYALIEAENGGLYRSDDGGDTWNLANGARYLRQRAWYYSTLTVHPRNPDVVWCPQVPMLRSIDGGKTFQRVKGLHHGDNHDLWIDPRNPRRLIGSNDGGVDISVDGGETWFSPSLPLAQFYHIAVDKSVPYRVSGAMQDLGTASGPSNSLSVGGISNGDWHDVGGGEAGFTASDPGDPNIVYAGEYGGVITRYDNRTGQARNVSIYPYNPSGHGGENLHYRFQWTAPILVSVHEPRTIYHAANVLFRSTDGGQHWTAISPDLTRNDKSKQKWSGGPITGDNTGVEIYDTIFAIAESPKQPGLIWAGSDDGLVHVTRDGGQHWANVTAHLTGLPEWGTVDMIEASPFDAGTAYVVVDAHRLDNMKPYLFKTSDFGQTWTRLSDKLPQDIYLHAVREDPVRKGMLYVGTERGIAFSTDDGASWQPLKLNLPTVAVHDLQIKNNDLVVGTHGRSVWILDQLQSLREMSPQIAEQELHLFSLPHVVRWEQRPGFHEKGIGDNPPSGAIIDYFLKEKPKAKITLEVLDGQGKLVNQFESKPKKKRPASEVQRKEIEEHPTEPAAEEEESEEDPDAAFERVKKLVLTTEKGVNRIAWDLRYKGALKIKRAKVDAGVPDQGPLVNPGTYTLKLKVGERTVTTTLIVEPDPRVRLAPEELEEQLRIALQLRDEITQLSRTVEQLRAIRQQLQDREKLLRGHSKADALHKPSRELLRKLDALEEKLHNPKAEVTYDILAQKGGAQLYSQLVFLYEDAKVPAPATEGTRQMMGQLAEELKRYTAQWHELETGELGKLNALAKSLSVPDIIVPTTVETAKKP